MRAALRLFAGIVKSEARFLCKASGVGAGVGFKAFAVQVRPSRVDFRPDGL